MADQKPETEKSIIELQNEIESFKRKERAYIVLLRKKDEIIKKLSDFKTYLISNLQEIQDYTNKDTKKNLYLNPIMLEHFKLLRNSLSEVEEANLRAEEKKIYQSSKQSGKLVKIAEKKLQDNIELLGYFNGNYIENMRQDNDNEKDQIQQLMLKLKDQESLSNDLIEQIDQACETKEFLNRKIKAKREEEGEKANKRPKN